MVIEASLPTDEPWIRQLLKLCDLPQEDISAEHLRHFFVVKEEAQVVAVVGVEVLVPFGLLRSLAADPKYRSRGYASQLIEKAEEYAA